MIVDVLEYIVHGASQTGFKSQKRYHNGNYFIVRNLFLFLPTSKQQEVKQKSLLSVLKMSLKPNSSGICSEMSLHMPGV